jgi:hypothetical protein
MSEDRSKDITDEHGNDCSEVDGWYAQYTLANHQETA